MTSRKVHSVVCYRVVLKAEMNKETCFFFFDVGAAEGETAQEQKGGGQRVVQERPLPGGLRHVHVGAGHRRQQPDDQRQALLQPRRRPRQGLLIDSLFIAFPFFFWDTRSILEWTTKRAELLEG